MTDRETLLALLGQWVTVTNPRLPAAWYGKLVALADDPSVLIQTPGQGQGCFPQSFIVAPAEPPLDEQDDDETPLQAARASIYLRDAVIEQLKTRLRIAEARASELEGATDIAVHAIQLMNKAGAERDAAEATTKRVRDEVDRWTRNALEPGQARRVLDDIRNALQPKE
ncbi:hypothetical protein ABZ135_01450 [Streptomyces sp. NPDC006339]|uniref:hypothetical protein n=1 Tax=Streptomyces sp. NPDC006339 TaxID=3156755 RepID=UPI0033AFB920